MSDLKLAFVPEKETKGTWKFDEQSDTLDTKVGTLYVKKTTLAELDWAEGKPLIVTIEV